MIKSKEDWTQNGFGYGSNVFFLQWQNPAWLCGIFTEPPLNHGSDSAGSWIFVLFKYCKKYATNRP